MSDQDETVPSMGVTPPLALLSTGVPGLDEVLGGGIPALSFNLIAGSPGSGKTTLAMQMLFATATTERPGLFITLLGETSLKMLRYQQAVLVLRSGRVGEDVHFLNLSEEALNGDLDTVLARIVAEVIGFPGVVVVDSFRSLVRKSRSGAAGEFSSSSYSAGAAPDVMGSDVDAHRRSTTNRNCAITSSPLPTVSAAAHQAVDRNSVVRKLQS
jgi:circadian clock protein KaiC